MYNAVFLTIMTLLVWNQRIACKSARKAWFVLHSWQQVLKFGRNFYFGIPGSDVQHSRHTNTAFFLSASQISFYLKSFYVFCVFGEYRQKIETCCELISLNTNFFQIMICWYYLECIADTLRGAGIWGSCWVLAREPCSHRHVWSKIEVWLMKGDLGCIRASPADPPGGMGLETGVCWRRLACIYLMHIFISVELVAEKSKLEAVFLCIASVKHRAWEHAMTLSSLFSCSIKCHCFSRELLVLLQLRGCVLGINIQLMCCMCARACASVCVWNENNAIKTGAWQCSWVRLYCLLIKMDLWKLNDV